MNSKKIRALKTKYIFAFRLGTYKPNQTFCTQGPIKRSNKFSYMRESLEVQWMTCCYRDHLLIVISYIFSRCQQLSNEGFLNMTPPLPQFGTLRSTIRQANIVL